MKIGVAIAVGAAAVVVAFKAGSSMVDNSPKKPAVSQATPTTSPSATASTAPSARLVEFRDDKAGWAISYPADWVRLPPDPADPDVALVVSESNHRGSIKARVIDLGKPVEEAKIPELTDKLVMTDGVQMITQPTPVRQAGLPGMFYFYSFKDSASGQEGVHSHYFLFKGPTMISFVFQALPKDDFPRLAGLYDEVIGSFRVL